MVRRAGPASPAPVTSVMRSPSMAMSAGRAGLPVPSTSVALRMTRSCDMGGLLDGRKDLAHERLGCQAGLVAIDVGRRAHNDEAVDAQRHELLQPADAVVGWADDAEA